jgi:Sec-independent protein translocase protein TatA
MIANVGDLPYVIVIALIVLVGGSQLPKIARNVGLAGKEFRKAQDEADREAEAERATKAQANVPPPVQVGPATPAAPPVGAPPVAAPVVASNQPPDSSVVLTRSELDALLKAREEQVRNEGGTSPASN